MTYIDNSYQITYCRHRTERQVNITSKLYLEASTPLPAPGKDRSPGSIDGRGFTEPVVSLTTGFGVVVCRSEVGKSRESHWLQGKMGLKISATMLS